MRIALHNFTGGEVSPILAARYDLSRYGSSVQCMENMLPGLHGDMRRRPGTLFLGSLEDEAVLLPFSFNALAEQNFVLVLSGNGLSIADIHGFDPQEGSIPRLPTPYEARHLLEICAAQVGDTVYLAHTAYPLHKLVRSTDSEPEAPLPENAIRSHGYRWTLEAVALNSSLPAPQAPSCTFVRGNNDDDAGLGYTLRYKIVAVDANGKQSLASEEGSCNGKHPSDWVVGNRTDISWTAVEGATEYNIYREEAGYYGFIGVSSGTTFSDNNYQADTADTPREDWDPFADGNNLLVRTFANKAVTTTARTGYVSLVLDETTERPSYQVDLEKAAGDKAARFITVLYPASDASAETVSAEFIDEEFSETAARLSVTLSLTS